MILDREEIMVWLRDVDFTCRIFKSIAEPSLIMIRKLSDNIVEPEER
jgi:hypothetical protein